MAIKNALRWLLVLAWLYLVIYLSRQSGTESAEISSWIARTAKKGLDFCGISVSYANLHLLLRKAAHFAIHFVLAWLMYAALNSTFSGQKCNIIICFIFCSIIAIFDESIQSTAPGRVAQLYDGILNLFGVQSGILFGILTTKKH
ncbi:VanZ family protein [Candidatus Saccharibacteria bacterium]|nr:VanZ family protein [Candidatus Saccharibacteria bacterium]